MHTAAEGESALTDFSGVVAGAGDHRSLHAAHGRRRAVPPDPRGVGVPIIVLSVKGEERTRSRRSTAAPTTT